MSIERIDGQAGVTDHTPHASASTREGTTPNAASLSVLNADAEKHPVADVSVGTEVKKSVQGPQDDADTKRNTVSSSGLTQAMDEVKTFLEMRDRGLAFAIDDDSRRTVVTVTDKASGETIRQIPSEEVLRLADRIRELQQDVGGQLGVLVDNQV